ncbi:hypothetical protein ACJZ2D_004096 [Fusarium nematophilum]
MKPSRIPLEEVMALAPVTRDNREPVDIFEKLGTEGCLLDCEAWKGRQELVDRRTMTRAQKTQQRRDKFELGRLSIARQRQTLNNDKRVPNSTLRWKRDPFKLEKLKDSGANGCGDDWFRNEYDLAVD